MRDYLFSWRQFNIKRTDTVLEVGSGQRPLIRSDILCDKFPFSSYERLLKAPVVIDRPFVAADALHLPFEDEAIDFLYCADLAEHLDQPHKFLDECMRVAHKGAIITPSILAERLFGWDYHAVMYEVRDGKLIIHRKTLKNWGWFGGTFHELCLDDKYFRQVFLRHPELFRVTYEWEDTIQYEYAPTEDPEDTVWRRVSSADHVVEMSPDVVESAKRKMRSLLSQILRKWFLRRKDIDLKPMLCCPACHGELNCQPAACMIECISCGRIYNVKNNVPMLLLDE